MSYKILTKNGVDNSNIDGARGEHFNAGMRSGIVKGALNEGEFASSSSNSIYLNSCELRICGHRIVIDEPIYKTLVTPPAVNTRYSFIAQIIVDSNSNVDFFMSIQDVNTPLIQDNLFKTENGVGTYQLEIGRFTHQTSGTITDITRTADLITGGVGGDYSGTINIGNVTTNTIDAGMEAFVDIEQRYDSQDNKIYTDFHFDIPQGVNGLNGAGSNPNLLINGDFRVNQRGLNIYSPNDNWKEMACVDRWLLYGTKTASFNVSNKVLKGQTWLLQRLEFVNKLLGNFLTATIRFQNITSASNIHLAIRKVFYNNTTEVIKDVQLDNSNLTQTITFIIPTDGDLKTKWIDLYYYQQIDSEVQFNYIKLELGKTATAFIEKQYQEELLNCQRYYQIIAGRKYARDTYNFYEPYNTFYTPMRINPTKTIYSLNSQGNIGTTPNIMFDTTSDMEVTVETALSYSSVYGFSTQAGNAALTLNHAYSYIVTCDAEIYRS